MQLEILWSYRNRFNKFTMEWIFWVLCSSTWSVFAFHFPVLAFIYLDWFHSRFSCLWIFTVEVWLARYFVDVSVGPRRPEGRPSCLHPPEWWESVGRTCIEFQTLSRIIASLPLVLTWDSWENHPPWDHDKLCNWIEDHFWCVWWLMYWGGLTDSTMW